MQEELKYLLALKEIRGIGNILAKQLIKKEDSAKAVFNKSASQLLKISRLSDSIVKEIIHFQDFAWIEDEITWCEKEGIEIIPFYSEKYPQRLLDCYDAPVVLFVKGKVRLNESKVVSIVGTRKYTEYGERVTEQIIEALAPFQVTIISGLALGIDSIAHKTALEHHLPTYGVLAHGLNQLYPRRHTSMATKMLENGGLISEFTRKDEFDKNNFPMRNRIVAGMSDATVMIESAISGGAMITAEMAHSYGREVFTVPGRWTDIASQGANKLIKNLKAQILTQANDLPENLGWKEGEQLLFDNFYDRKEKYQNLDESEMQIVSQLMYNQPVSIDMLHNSTDIAVGLLSSLLLSLEFKGVIKSLPGKRYALR
ncbi:MAG: DNA-processing protein DprA [Chitinophagales bacterium]|nr:DNA-processing protein DprA [Chitinophagales bacterium]